MRVLIFHGYLLRGTGSNVYNANLAQTLRRLGHEVHLICQDRQAEELDWVDAFSHHAEEGGRPRRRASAGSVTVHVPDIGGLLPVYVADRYAHFEVKPFPELSEEELQRYLDANVAAVRDVVEAYGEPDAALANHLIMGPAILARAGLRFALKVHGSDLSYTVRPHRERFAPYAREGVDAASGVLVGSTHTAEDLWETLNAPELRDKTRLGPPGVDVHSFRPRSEEEEALRGVEALARTMESEHAQEHWGREGGGAAEALRRWAAGRPRVLFVGKLLVNKGVDLLLAAWPLVHREHPGARLLLAGFGGFQPGIEALLHALDQGDLPAAREVAHRGRAYEGGKEAPLPILSSFLEGPPPGYEAAARETEESIALSGRLDHDEVAEVMPAADVFVMPSTFPEAFGMVAAEAAACGVPPVSAEHSGMGEVSRQLAEAVGPELGRLLSFPVGEGAVGEIAGRINGWLALDPGRREEAGGSLARRVAELWSWEGVAEGVIAASRGELESLPEVARGEAS